MFMESFAVGCLACNCTILACDRTKEAVIIDPGDEKDKILKIVNDNNLQVKYLLHTHAHFDHIGAAGPMKREGYGKIMLHKGDNFLYDALDQQGRMFGFDLPPKDTVDEAIEDEDEISFGDHHLKILHTPGHTPGSCSFVLEDEDLLFTGDTLFRRSIGRTDLPGGDFSQIMDSIQGKLLKLDKDYKIIPGHGECTCLSEESRANPFLKE